MYCEEDSPLDAGGECPRCERRTATVESAAFYADTVLPELANDQQRRVAREVLQEASDFPRALVDWARIAAVPHPTSQS